MSNQAKRARFYAREKAWRAWLSKWNKHRLEFEAVRRPSVNLLLRVGRLLEAQHVPTKGRMYWDGERMIG